MYISQYIQKLRAALAGTILLTVNVGVSTSATAFEPHPLFEKSTTYTTTIPRADGSVDTARIYYPISATNGRVPTNLPIALMLQGALVDQENYANFAHLVARYGFAVVVPNHSRTVSAPNGRSFSGFLSEQQQVHDVLAFLKTENTNTGAPLLGRVDTTKLGLLGHSFGGSVGLAAVQNACIPIVCVQQYTRPPELKAAAFYGTSFSISGVQKTIPPIQNRGVPIALLAGNKDGVVSASAVKETYQQIQEQPKALITILGANHYSITNTDNSSRERNRPALEQATATETIARWSALFLRAVMLRDVAAFNYVFKTGDALDPNVTINTSIPAPVSTTK